MEYDMSSGIAKSKPDAGKGLPGEVQARFVGTWSLASLGGEGGLVERLGESPVGILIYDPSGNMSVQIMNGERAGIPLRTGDDFKAAFQSYIAYFGRYSLDVAEESVTHHVAGSLYPRDVGREFKRLYEFEGDTLILTAIGVIGGEDIAARLVWQRVR